jgi:hypothetical protein
MNNSLSLALLVLIGMGVGLASCFYGYRLIRWMSSVWGFLVGALAGMYLAQNAEQLVQVIVMLVLGFIGVILGNYLRLVGIFLIGAGMGAASVILVASALNLTTDLAWVVIGAGVGGITALSLQRPVLIGVTAFGGAALLVLGAAELFTDSRTFSYFAGGRIPYTNPWLWLGLLAWAILAVWGLFYQLRHTRRV